MIYEERYTFGSLMSLLTESERKLKEVYEAAAKTSNDPQLKALLSDFGRNSSKRIERIRTARIETVVEMTLESITGLRLTEPLTRINATIENGQMSNLEKLLTLERAISELYSRTSPKVKQISAETGELLTALCDESTARVLELEHYLKPA